MFLGIVACGLISDKVRKAKNFYEEANAMSLWAFVPLIFGADAIIIAAICDGAMNVVS